MNNIASEWQPPKSSNTTASVLGMVALGGMEVSRWEQALNPLDSSQPYSPLEAS